MEPVKGKLKGNKSVKKFTTWQVKLGCLNKSDEINKILITNYGYAQWYNENISLMSGSSLKKMMEILGTSPSLLQV